MPAMLNGLIAHSQTLQKKRIKALMLWVKDMIRAQVDVDFEDGATRSQFHAALKAALDREQMRKDQRKAGESFLDNSFDKKLKSQAQWDKFVDELDSTLA